MVFKPYQFSWRIDKIQKKNEGWQCTCYYDFCERHSWKKLDTVGSESCYNRSEEMGFI
jgi:hypothetical protein